jgi:hypothetical protein
MPFEIAHQCQRVEVTRLEAPQSILDVWIGGHRGPNARASASRDDAGCLAGGAQASPFGNALLPQLLAGLADRLPEVVDALPIRNRNFDETRRGVWVDAECKP